MTKNTHFMAGLVSILFAMGAAAPLASACDCKKGMEKAEAQDCPDKKNCKMKTKGAKKPTAEKSEKTES